MITCYVDGACRGNPGPGGWGVLVELPDGSTVEHWGGNPATTNQRMELTAVAEALIRTPIDQPLTIYTDSQYAIGVADPASGWKIRANLATMTSHRWASRPTNCWPSPMAISDS
ncbi:MAG: RNase H family protein [Dongiaceae bacterium]